jgi:hypothetical protein
MMNRMVILLAAILIPTAATAQESLVKGLTDAAMPTVFVLDDRGVETRGRLVKLDEQAVVLLVDGERRRFETARVNRVTRRGDSLRNGAITGAVVGGVMAVLTSGIAECRNDRGGYGSCGAGARVGMGLALVGIYSAIGTGIDAAIQGRTVLYQAPSLRIAADTKSASVGLTLRW